MLRSIDQEKCIGCGACFKTCGFDVFRLDTRQPFPPRCQEICPMHIDVRGYVHLLQQGKTKLAAERLLSANPLPALASRTCPVFCEKKCVRKDLDESVNINALEQYLGDWLLSHTVDPVPVSRTGFIAIIGSGAAGLSSAYLMRQAGFKVVVFEKESTLGGQFRVPELKDVLKDQLDWLVATGVEFCADTAVGDSERTNVKSLKNQRARAIIIATGSEKESDKRQPPPFSSVVDINEDGEIMADPKTLATRTNGIFAAGSVRGGSRLVPFEVRDGVEAAHSALCFINGWDMLESRPALMKPAVSMPLDRIPISRRNHRKECAETHELLTMDYETMICEASRCLTCGSKAYARYRDDCMTCYFCEMACHVGSIRVNPFKEPLPRTLEFEREGVN